MCANKLPIYYRDLKKIISPFFLQFFAVLEVIFYTILPTIVLILFWLIDKNSKIGDDCYIHGEFLLYSIALLSSSYTTMKVYKNQNTSLIILLIIAISILYVITIKTSEENIKKDMLLWISIITSIISFCFTWHAMNLKNNTNEGKSFQERDSNASKGIEDKLTYDD